MVARKYLCSAPHPSTWDQRARALLKSLGGSVKRRTKLLKQTLESLEAVIGETKRGGPGRKSNAEHALNFYEYVLSLNEKASEDKGAEMESDLDDSEERPDDEDQEDEKSVVTMETQEFLDQHNDLCEVCNEGGDLLCCSTCNLVFHLKCSRPKLRHLPPDNWSCSYCIASGVTGHKREARTRRRAAAAVRLMNRLRKGDGGEDDEDEEDLGEEEEIDGGEAPATEVEDQSDNKDEPPENNLQQEIADKAFEVSPRKRKHEDDENDEERVGKRSRRARRQPTLYDPQDCAASEWQSDGLFEWKTLSASETGVPHSDTEGDEEEAEEVDKKEARQARKKKAEEDTVNDDHENEPPWCNFCRDDPSIPLCCFCACRVCFGKHDASKLLLCDKCDAEYHTYCLRPPLADIPLSKKWYCPSCRADNRKKKREADQSVSTGKSPAMYERSSSRKSTSPSSEKMKRQERFLNGNMHSQPASTPKRSGKLPTSRNSSADRNLQGRPPANVKGLAGKSSPVSESRRHRGCLSIKRSEIFEEQARKGALSPAEVKSLTDDDDLYRAEGYDTGEATSDRAGSPSPPRIIKRSRSGRMVKRNIFHDEIEEGEQHLRSSNKPSSSSSKGSVSRSKSPPDDTKASDNPIPLLIHPDVTEKGPAASQASGISLKVEELDADRKNEQLLPIESQHILVPAEIATDLTKVLQTSLDTPSQILGQQNATVSGTGGSLRESQVATVIADDRVQPRESQVATVIADDRVQPQGQVPTTTTNSEFTSSGKVPRRKPGARECLQISRRFGTQVIPEKYIETLLDYCSRGKVEHLIRMRERLDDHSRFLEAQLAGLETLVEGKGEIDVVVPPMTENDEHAPSMLRASPPLSDSLVMAQISMQAMNSGGDARTEFTGGRSITVTSPAAITAAKSPILVAPAPDELEVKASASTSSSSPPRAPTSTAAPSTITSDK